MGSETERLNIRREKDKAIMDRITDIETNQKETNLSLNKINLTLVKFEGALSKATEILTDKVKNHSDEIKILKDDTKDNGEKIIAIESFYKGAKEGIKGTSTFFTKYLPWFLALAMSLLAFFGVMKK
jgi:hypothetical protein